MTQAYSLFGILSVNIDIRYGERGRAFERLQEALVDTNIDQSIFAWGYCGLDTNETYVIERLLAPSPDAFAHCRNIVPFSQAVSSPRLTNRGIHMTCPMVMLPFVGARGDEYYGLVSGDRMNIWNAQLWLGCRYEHDPMTAIMLNVCGCNADESNVHVRRLDEQPFRLGTWTRMKPSSGTVRRLPLPRLSYVNSIKASERATSTNAVVLRPSPASDLLDGSREEQRISTSMWISITSSEGYSAPRIENVQSNLQWRKDRDPCLLEAETFMPSGWFHAAVTVRYIDHPAAQFMFAGESISRPPQAHAFLMLDFASSTRLRPGVELLQDICGNIQEYEFESDREMRAKWSQSVRREGWQRLPVERSLRLDRSLLLVVSMKRTHLNGETMVIVQARVEPISRYWSRQLSRRLQARPRATIAHFTFSVCAIIVFGILIALVLAWLINGELAPDRQEAMTILAASFGGVAASIIEYRWRGYPAQNHG